MSIGIHGPGQETIVPVIGEDDHGHISPIGKGRDQQGPDAVLSDGTVEHGRIGCPDGDPEVQRTIVMRDYVLAIHHGN